MDLIKAVKTNNLKHVRLLVEQGADKEEGDSNGYTPLYWASYMGYFDTVEYLVEQGSPLEKAIDKFGYTALIIAAERGHLDVCRYLLEQGADWDKANNYGDTPLHWAAFFGRLEIAMLLMSYGADLNARNKAEKLPIDLARTEEIKQAIRDEPRRRMDHGHKRATEQDRHPNAATSASAQQEEEEKDHEEKEEPSNKRPRLYEEGVAAVEEGS